MPAETGGIKLARWADVVGHERQIEILRRAWHSGRVHHATLLAGPDGVGKAKVAEAFASMLLCSTSQTSRETDAPSWEPCGTCQGCLMMARGEHPDTVRVEADGRTIKVDTVREMQKAIRSAPLMGARRVVLIENAEVMREAAANALLKTLEEPIGGTIFMLVTSESHRLLPTIRSRCQPLRFGRLNNDEIRRVLATTRTGDSVPDAAIHLSAGSPGKALALSDSDVLNERANVAEELLKATVGDSGDALLTAATWAADKREGAEQRLDIAVWVLRDAVLRSVGETQREMNTDLSEPIMAIADAFSAEDLTEMIHEVEHMRERIGGYVNPRMLIESWLLGAQARQRRQ